MDKREFDGGNPQQDAPRRVEKKKIWTRRRLLWLGIVAAVLLAVVAVSLLWQKGYLDGLRRVIYARAEKDENRAPSYTSMRQTGSIGSCPCPGHWRPPTAASC
ncbi:MAG: hypothetical protein ACLUIX_06630 [Oscillospiraceae bacterium]